MRNHIITKGMSTDEKIEALVNRTDFLGTWVTVLSLVVALALLLYFTAE